MMETELASAVIGYLQDQNWKTYQEVQWPGLYSNYYPRADIAAVQDGLLYVVETKLSLGLPVIAQAHYWSQHAHFVSIATPSRRKARERGNDRVGETAMAVLSHFGIGWFSLDNGGLVTETVPPRLNRKPIRVAEIRDSLHEGHNEFAAGNADGKRWSHFRETCDNLRTFVQKHPGTPFREAIDSIDHHYRKDSTARSCLKNWIDRGSVKGVSLKREGRHLLVFPGVQEAQKCEQNVKREKNRK